MQQKQYKKEIHLLSCHPNFSGDVQYNSYTAFQSICILHYIPYKTIRYLCLWNRPKLQSLFTEKVLQLSNHLCAFKYSQSACVVLGLMSPVTTCQYEYVNLQMRLSTEEVFQKLFSLSKSLHEEDLEYVVLLRCFLLFCFQFDRTHVRHLWLCLTEGNESYSTV